VAVAERRRARVRLDAAPVVTAADFDPVVGALDRELDVLGLRVP
jgi:hypothetical protein